jgi:hypothetical protein
MMTSLDVHAMSDTSRPEVVACELCGTRFRVRREPDPLEVGSDSLVTLASHRCVPRVSTRRRA